MPPAPGPLDDLGVRGGWAAQAGAPSALENRSMYVHCVGTGRGDASDVSIQWRESTDCPGAHEVLLKYRGRAEIFFPEKSYPAAAVSTE